MRPPTKAQRDSNEAAIVATLRAMGAVVYLLDKPLDLLVAYRGKWTMLEVKESLYKARPLAMRVWPKDGRKLTSTEQAQREVFAAVRHVGAPVFFVTTPEEAVAAIK